MLQIYDNNRVDLFLNEQGTIVTRNLPVLNCYVHVYSIIDSFANIFVHVFFVFSKNVVFSSPDISDSDPIHL